ncbi:MAG: hypothetical protein WCF84_18025 [Anaerolineae bacterium]
MKRLAVLALGLILILAAFLLASNSSSYDNAPRPQVAQVMATSLHETPTLAVFPSLTPIDTVTPLPPTRTPSPAPSPTSTLLPNAIRMPDDFGWLDRSRSLDLHWEAWLGSSQPVTVTSIISNQIILKEKLPVALGEYPGPVYWFPDNTGLVVYDGDHGCEKCDWDRLLIYRINQQGWFLERSAFEPLARRNEAFWEGISWSPDGSRFAVVVGFHEIYLLNRQAWVLQKITPKLTEHELIDQVAWTDMGIVYLVRTFDTDPPQPSEMRLTAPYDRNQPDKVLRSGSDYPAILAVAPDQHRLLIAHDWDHSSSGLTGELGIFNLETRRFERTFCLYRDYPYDLTVAGSRFFVAFQCGDSNLSILNWDTGQVTAKQIHVDEIIGWRQDLEAFTVLQRRSDGDWLALVRP